MTSQTLGRVWRALASLKLTIACLSLLMILVVACTLAQVDLGTLGAVRVYIRSFWLWWDVPGADLRIPVFPGGALVGLLLGVNLVVAQVRRLELSWKKAGLWIVHAGLILLFAGEYVTALLQRDMQLAIEEGQTVDYVEAPKRAELAVVDTTDPSHDDHYAVPESLLARASEVPLPGTPITLKIRRFVQNADLRRRTGSEPGIATMGVGPEVAVRALPPVVKDDESNRPAVVIEPLAGGRSYGTWLVADGLGATQSFRHEGRTYELAMRPQRQYLPYSLKLKDFSHDVYPGTTIPKNFSSLVHLSHPAAGESRDVLIYMNQPLRYAGMAFYQASFGKNDTLSVLQVVENPGWLLPYVSCVLVTIGLLVHFAISLRRALRRRSHAAVGA